MILCEFRLPDVCNDNYQVIVELTPSHWFRFGLEANSSLEIDVISSLTEKYRFEAYALFFPVARRPPVQLAHIVHPIHTHPILPMVCRAYAHIVIFLYHANKT